MDAEKQKKGTTLRTNLARNTSGRTATQNLHFTEFGYENPFESIAQRLKIRDISLKWIDNLSCPSPLHPKLLSPNSKARSRTPLRGLSLLVPSLPLKRKKTHHRQRSNTRPVPNFTQGEIHPRAYVATWVSRPSRGRALYLLVYAKAYAISTTTH